MITKKQVLEAALRGEGALGKAHDDEPVFCLRAQDCLSDEMVDIWAIRARLLVPTIDGEKAGHKVTEAMQIAEAMRSWPIRKHPN